MLPGQLLLATTPALSGPFGCAYHRGQSLPREIGSSRSRRLISPEPS